MLKLIDFWAEWCAPCKIMTPILEDVEKEFLTKLEIVKINVDENPELASKYGVLSIPTYVFEKENVEVERLIGARPKAEIAQIIQKHSE